MMTRLARTTAALLAFALLATGCGVLSGNGSYEVQAQFTRAFNLFPGSPIKVLGIDVGRIADVAISTDTDLVTVTMRVDEDVEIPANANAIVVPESLLGERFIQLDPPYTGGETLDGGAVIPVDRTSVPFEFDEVLEGLNRFVGGLEADGVGDLVTNLATVLEGQGDELGRTIDAAEAAIGVLRENDEDLISLASRLADLNETLATRDDQLGEVIRDFSSLSRVLADEQFNIDQALTGLLRLSDELARLLETHREDLQQDIATVTRVGRTAQRNLEEISLLVLSSAELYRHAARVVDRERNFLPLLNHFGELDDEITRNVTDRLEHLCLNSGLPAEQCQTTLEQLNEIVGSLCIPGLLPCPDDEEGLPLGEGIAEIVENAPPELGQAIVDTNRDNDTGLADVLEQRLRDSVGGLVGGTDEEGEG